MFTPSSTSSTLLCAPSPHCHCYGTFTLSGQPFQVARNGSALIPVPRAEARFGLFRFRSPLLTESRLLSFPPATEMFQLAGFASTPYAFRCR